MIQAPRSSEKAVTLVLAMAQAQGAVEEFATGQIDAVIDSEGKAYLLRAAQEEVRQNQRRLQTVLDSTTDVIVVVDRFGAVASQNRAASLMFGHRPAPESSFFDMVHPEDFHRFYSAFFNVLEYFSPQAVVACRLQLRDGSFGLFEANLNALRDFSAKCIVLSARDMSRRGPEGSRELAEGRALQAKDQMLVSLCRELLAQLKPIISLGTSLEDRVLGEALPTLAKMQSHLELQGRMLDHLLKPSAAEGGDA